MKWVRRNVGFWKMRTRIVENFVGVVRINYFKGLFLGHFNN